MNQLRLCTYYISWCTHAGSRGAVAVGSVSTGAQLSAALAVVTRWAGLIAVKPRPACCTGALSRQRVTAERGRKTFCFKYLRFPTYHTPLKNQTSVSEGRRADQTKAIPDSIYCNMAELNEDSEHIPGQC